MTHLDLEAAGARPHRDLVHLPLAAAGPALVAATATPVAAAPLALPVLPAFVVAAAAAALVLAAGVVLLAPEAGPEAAPELVHPARPLFQVLQEKRKARVMMSNVEPHFMKEFSSISSV